MELNILIALLLAFNVIKMVKGDSEDTSPNCTFSVMSHKMRRTVLSGHNGRRSLLAQGKVKRKSGCSRSFPEAANMLEMKYDCDLEKKAAHQDLCKKIPRRTDFEYRGRNYAYIKTRILNFRPVLSPTDALLAAMRDWWDTHLRHRGLHGITPRKKDYPMLPFLMMANGRTEAVGCTVDLCYVDKNFNATEKYYAVLCFYQRPHVRTGWPLYIIGTPCSLCPCGYECDRKRKLCRRRNYDIFNIR